MADPATMLGFFQILSSNIHSHLQPDIQSLIEGFPGFQIAFPVEHIPLFLGPKNLLEISEHELAVHDPLRGVDQVSSGGLLGPEYARGEANCNVLAAHFVVVLIFQDLLFEECEDEHKGSFVQLWKGFECLFHVFNFIFYALIVHYSYKTVEGEDRSF